MSTISVQEQIDVIKKTSQEILGSKEKTISFLVSAGIIKAEAESKKEKKHNSKG